MALSNDDLITAILNGSGKKGLTGSEASALEFLGQQKNGLKPKQESAEELQKRKEEELQKLKDSLSPLQFLLTDVTHGTLPKSGINHVMEKYPDDHWAEEFRPDIPEVDPLFHWDADVLEAVWLAYILDEKMLLTGPPGTGKTSVTHQLAAWLRQPYARFNGKDGVEPSAFLGYSWATKEGMEWRDGLMPIAVREGYLTVIDEVFKLPPGVQMAMQSLYEKNGFLMLDEKPGTIADKHVRPCKDFRLYGTDNTKGTGDNLGSYAAGQVQDVSTLDRFTITKEVGYMEQTVEVGNLQKRYPALEQKVLTKVVSFANLVREGFKTGDMSLTMSPRGNTVVCSLVQRKINLKTALQLCFVNKLGDDREVSVANAYITSAI